MKVSGTRRVSERSITTAYGMEERDMDALLELLRVTANHNEIVVIEETVGTDEM